MRAREGKKERMKGHNPGCNEIRYTFIYDGYEYDPGFQGRDPI